MQKVSHEQDTGMLIVSFQYTVMLGTCYATVHLLEILANSKPKKNIILKDPL